MLLVFCHDLEVSKQAKHMHMLMTCLPEILGISEMPKIEKINHFQMFLSNFHLDVISLRRKYRPSTKTMRKKKMHFVLHADDFWHLEAAKQATHMHMHMIESPEILGISEMVRINKITYFQFFLFSFSRERKFPWAQILANYKNDQKVWKC